VVFLKSSIVGLIMVVSVVPFWLFYDIAIQDGSIGNIASLYAFIFLTIHLIALGILLLFSERPYVFMLPASISAFPLLYFFGISIPTIIIIFLYSAFAYHAVVRVKEEIKSRINFKLAILLRQGLPILLTALSLVLAVTYFIETSRVPERFTFQDIIPPSFVSAILDRISPITAEQMGVGLNTTLTVDEYIKKQLVATGIEINTLSEDQQNKLLSEARDSFSKTIFTDPPAIAITGNEKVGDIFYELIAVKSEMYLEPYQRFIPLAFAIGFFLFLRTIAFPYGWLITWFTTAIIHALKWNRLIIRIEETTTKERYEWA
jgi:hypothetical protein